ncbi:efflux RND transporter periplasmic adaptor subunit [Candidatus Peregrinibacteria bacterium]|nr:efflux RND transporter periplasmic adaptor subunit [Candidatus Peregrinibacteria bacterium]MBT7337606.1 efflux RND transporter periplasmic adaptor subunit [Candidatus Peregrinibacteria bacterium]
MRIISLIIAAGVVVILLVLRGCSSAPEQEVIEATLPKVEVLSIASGLQRNMSATGEVEAEKSANFGTDFKATVKEIKANIGDIVKEGDVLVTLRAFEVEQKFTTANAFYVTTGQNLQQTRIQTQQNVDDAKIALKSAQINQEKLTKENAAKTVQTEETLKSTTLNFGLSEASADAALDAAIRKTVTTVHSALTRADEILEFSPEQVGLTYEKETHIGVRDPTQKLKVSDAMIDAYNAYRSIRPTYKDSLGLLEQTEITLSMSLTTLHNSVTSTVYTVTDLNTDITDINTKITNVRTVISELNTAKASLDAAMQSTGGRSQVIIDAEAAYATSMAQIEASQKKAELDIERAKNSLESAIASAKSSEISAFSNITTARGELDLARINQNELSIIAPFDGVVTGIPLRIGREVQPGDLILTMENAEWLKIITYVSAEEVRQITPGDEVMVDGEYKARVASVSPSADPASKKFKVELRIGGDSLQVGSFVELQFSLRTVKQQDDDRIFLPVTSVHVSAAETFVWVVTKETEELENASSEDIYIAKKRAVTIGALSGRYIEIVDGIAKGDHVIIEGGRALSIDGQHVLLLP